MLESFVHGTPAGWLAGCKGAGCVNHGTDLDTCARAWVRYQGDYSYRKRVDAGWSPERLREADLADVQAAVVVERAQRQALRELVREAKPAKVSRLRAPTAPRQPKSPVVREPKVPEHGTLAGYRAGCFTSACPASPTCEEVNLVRIGLLKEKATMRRQKNPKPKQSELPAEHGTLTMHRRGCRGEDCPVSPSCAEVAKAFYSERNRTMVRSVKGHGTNASWARGCRCEDCHEAHKQYHREYLRTRRESVPVGSHGTAYGYQLGCRDREACPGSPEGVTCSDASLAEERRRRREAGIDERVMVDAAPVIEHLQHLRAHGLGVLKIESLSGVGHTAIGHLIYGRVRRGVKRVPQLVTAESVEKLMAVRG